MKTMTLKEFYQESSLLVPKEIGDELGHFNIFDVGELVAKHHQHSAMPYNRKTYYKISLIKGRNRAEYADKVYEIEDASLLFASPLVPYHWIPRDSNQSGFFCIFTKDFFTKANSGISLDALPIFMPGGYPVFQLSPDQFKEIEAIFQKMYRDFSSTYLHKYDLLRNYVLELIHYGQKLQPETTQYNSRDASARITSLFIELLERQFPIESPRQRLKLRSAADYAERLAVHVNHLNKVLKRSTGRTTTEHIGSRIYQEARVLLKHTDWNITEISECLGFEEVAHFSAFFKKRERSSPLDFRKGSIHPRSGLLKIATTPRHAPAAQTRRSKRDRMQQSSAVPRQVRTSS